MNIGADRQKMRRTRAVQGTLLVIVTFNAAAVAWMIGAEALTGWVATVVAGVSGFALGFVLWGYHWVHHWQRRLSETHGMVIALRQFVAESGREKGLTVAQFLAATPEVMTEDSDDDYDGRAWWQPGYTGPRDGRRRYQVDGGSWED